MNFKNKDTDVVGFGILVMSLILGISFFGLQEPVIAQTTGGNSTPAQATPVTIHHHKHKNLMTDNKIPNEGVQPGKPLDGENPTITMVPVGTVSATPNSH
jgi:hypothetical protein